MGQEQWGEIVEQSELGYPGVAKEYGVSYGLLRKYVRGMVVPRKRNYEKMEAIMSDLMKRPAMIKHPSFGYATPDEIEKLKTMGRGPEFDKLMGVIAKRTKKGGKK